MILKYIPNALTFLRIALIAPFLAFLYQKEYSEAFYIFFFAGFTDALDGWLARHFHWKSHFGSFIDPLADKFLVVSSFVSLAFIGKLPWWLVFLVFLRDVTISAGVTAWYWFIRCHLDFKPTLLSKINTLLQLSLVTFCLFELAFFELGFYLRQIFIFGTATTTIASYIDYVFTWSRKAYSVNHLTK